MDDRAGGPVTTWLTHPDNPLTARVLANRLFAELEYRPAVGGVVVRGRTWTTGGGSGTS